MWYMQNTGQILVQYVACMCNEQDPEFVLDLTFDKTMDILQQAFVEDQQETIIIDDE